MYVLSAARTTSQNWVQSIGKQTSAIHKGVRTEIDAIAEEKGVYSGHTIIGGCSGG